MVGLLLGVTTGLFSSSIDAILEHDSSATLSEDPELRTFKIELKESNGTITSRKYTGSMWEYEGVLRGKISPGPWDTLASWEGPGNYSTKHQGVGVMSLPQYADDSAHLKQEVSVPEEGLTVFSVRTRALIHGVETIVRNTQVDSSCADSYIKLLVEDLKNNEDSLLTQKVVDQEWTWLNASLEEFTGENITVEYRHVPGGECPLDMAQISRFEVTQRFG